MELTQLRYFIEAADTENLSRAARNLNISQPSLSISIARLEDELGVKLFYRHAKKVILSEHGKEFLDSILPAIDMLTDARGRFVQDKNLQSKRLVIGVCGTSSLLNPCIISYLKQHKDTGIRIISNIEKIVRLDIREYDALLYSDENYYFTKYKGTEIKKEKYLLAVARERIPEKEEFLSMQQLEDLPLITTGRLSAAEKILLNHSPQKRFVFSVDDRSIQTEFVLSGAGICLVPESESGCFSSLSGIALIQPDCPGQERKMNICFKKKKLLSSEGRQFRDFVYSYYHISDPYSAEPTL